MFYSALIVLKCEIRYIDAEGKSEDDAMVDEKVFFREATLRICGSLEIEKALWDCLMYIRDYIPADMIFMSVYDPGTGITETLAKADIQSGQIVSSKLTVPQALRRIINDISKNADRTPRIIVTDRVNKNPLLEPISMIAGNPDAAFMAIGPKPEWNLSGGIFVGNNAGEKYTDKHVQLFSLLNEPFAIAFSSKYPPAEPEALRLLAPQRGLIAIENPKYFMA